MDAGGAIMGNAARKDKVVNRDYGDEGLARLRKRLWLRSSVLTCVVLVLALGAAWLASASSARNTSNGALHGVDADSLHRVALLDAYEGAQPSVLAAFEQAIQEAPNSGDDWKPTALGADTYYSVSGPVENPFSLAVFEDGSMLFLVPPLNVQDGEGHPMYSMNWCEASLEELVETAFALRADAGKRPGPQYIELDGMTWKCATSIAVTNPRYHADATGESGVTLYADGRLEGYEKDGYLAARMYSFVDVTPTIIYLKGMAKFLAVLGVVGCVMLVVVCHKIIDRALVPVAESRARQRDFLIKASHELKTPMASLSSNLDALVANGGETVASQERWTDNMREDIDELADRTCKLLDLVTQSDGVGGAPPRPRVDSDV